MTIAQRSYIPMHEYASWVIAILNVFIKFLGGFQQACRYLMNTTILVPPNTNNDYNLALLEWEVQLWNMFLPIVEWPVHET